MVDDSPLLDLERGLPAERFDVLIQAMVPARLPLYASILTETPYAYFDADRERFGWLADPLGTVGDVGDVYAPRGRSLTGEVHWSVLLRRRRSGWRVEKALSWGSLSEARLAAGMEWASRAGFLIRIQDDRWVVGPALSELADPGRYLEVIGKAKERERRDR